MCIYCGNRSGKTDDYGNCIGCGAPTGATSEVSIQHPLVEEGRPLMYSIYHSYLPRPEGLLTCPGCQKVRKGIPHGGSAFCNKCGLQMERWGNALYIGSRIKAHG
jgi:predicted amidophosphoribosyltransferase